VSTSAVQPLQVTPLSTLGQSAKSAQQEEAAGVGAGAGSGVLAVAHDFL
jgi:hypothetical protein